MGDRGRGLSHAREAGTWLLVILGLATFVWRFVDLSNAPFLLDEPQLLDAARRQLLTGEWQARSSLHGTSGIYYGAAAIWFYTLIQWAAGPSPYVAIAAMGTLLSVAQVFFCVALTRAVLGDRTNVRWFSVLSPEGRIVLGSLLLLVGSSPHQHYWSRLAWDPLTNACAFAVVAVLLHMRLDRWYGPAAIGAMLGLGLASHPMLAPFAVVAATAAVVWGRPRNWPTIATRGLVLAIPLMVILLPWLLTLGASTGYEGNLEPGTGLTLEWMLEPFRAPGTAGVEHFFGGEWDTFASSASVPPGLDILFVVSPMLWVGLGLGGLILAVRQGRPRLRLLALCGFANLALYPAFYALLGTRVEPHYQFPTGWIAVAGVGVLLAASSRRIREATLVLVLVLAVGQLLFIASWRDWIDERGGTRTANYAVPLGEQLHTVEEVCTSATGPVAVELDILTFPVSFEYLSSITPACSRHGVRWCPPRSDCALPRPGEQSMRVRYAESRGARLEVVKGGRDSDYPL